MNIKKKNICQVFDDFKLAHDNIHYENLYNIMTEFGFSTKLIILTKMFMNGTKYQVKIDQILSEEFHVITGLKQRDAFHP